MRVRIKQIDQFSLNMDNVTTSYYVEVAVDGDWIVSFLEKINPFSYVTIFLDSSGKNSIEFYHDNKGWLPTEVHDEFIFHAAVNKIDSLGKYHSAEELEEIVRYLTRIEKIRALS